MAPVIEKFGPLIGRLLIATLFISAAYDKVFSFGATSNHMAEAGLPMTDVLLALSIAIELLGGILLIIGWQVRWAALVLFLWIIPVTITYHDFWTMDAESVEHLVNRIMFLKNLAIMGAMLFIAAFGAGSYSLEKRSS